MYYLKLVPKFFVVVFFISTKQIKKTFLSSQFFVLSVNMNCILSKIYTSLFIICLVTFDEHGRKMMLLDIMTNYHDSIELKVELLNSEQIVFLLRYG